ncbi:MAG TPA: hypothetical protein VG294_00895 [Solirubrobacteraceae bacterium]|jgi:hypothetical protein|nr:hypothetical protein [Solirubrobacteraceae bacterium]
MRDLAALTGADFEGAVGTDFEIDDGESGAVKIRLAEVVLMSERPGHRRPFSLRFHGPLSPVLPHLTHHLEHAEIGSLELFLGPIAAEPDRIVYEAVFA